MKSDDIPISISADGLILCPYCRKIKGHSKKFKNRRRLSSHLTRYHQNDFAIVDITNVPGVTIPDKFLQKLELLCNGI